MGFKVVQEGFSGYLGAILISSKIPLIAFNGPSEEELPSKDPQEKILSKDPEEEHSGLKQC